MSDETSIAPLVTGLDLETTGLDWTEGERIIETALIVYEWPTMEERLRFVRRTSNEERKINPKAQKVHGISAGDLVGAPKFADIAKPIAKILRASKVVFAHNGASFDFPFLLHELQRCGLTLPASTVYFDTMLEARWATYNGKMPSLGELCFALGVHYDPAKAHAADYDVGVMAQCFKRGFDLGYYKEETLHAEDLAA